MKKLIFATTVLVLLAIPVLAAKQSGLRPAFTAGARLHQEHSVFLDLPFEDDDVSYLLGWEYHDQNGYWQLLVGYTPDVGGTNMVDYVITPQLNLVLEDRGWEAGVGILGSYIVTDVDEDWTDVYWQLSLGFHLPIAVLDVEFMAYYPFETWDDLSEFEGKDIDYGILVRYYY